MLKGTRIPPVDEAKLPDDLRATLEEQRKLRGAPLPPARDEAPARGAQVAALFARPMIIAWENASSRFNRAFRIPPQGFWQR